MSNSNIINNTVHKIIAQLRQTVEVIGPLLDAGQKNKKNQDLLGLQKNVEFCFVRYGSYDEENFKHTQKLRKV